jgi:protease I
MPDLSHKRTLIVLAYKDFQDHEFNPVKKYLDMFGAHIDIASSSLGTAIGKFGTRTEIDYLVSDIHPENYDAVIFIGGPGAEEFKEDINAFALAKGASKSCQVLAAICITPIILARAGVLKNKKATVWTSELDRTAVQILNQHKAKYINKDVVVDGKIVTASGPEAADKFARTIVDMLSS